MNSLMKRRVPRACSSITKAKMTSWVPRRGMSVRVDLASLETGRDRLCHSDTRAQTALSLCAHPLCYLSHEHSSLKMPWTGCLGVCVWRGAQCRGQDSRSSEAAKNREKSFGIAHQAWVGKEGYTGLQTECPRVSLWWKGRPRAPLQPT